MIYHKIVMKSFRFAQHLAASRGYEDITIFLIQEQVDINAEGKVQK